MTQAYADMKTFLIYSLKNSKPNVKIGTYSPRFNIIITDNEIIA